MAAGPMLHADALQVGQRANYIAPIRFKEERRSLAKTLNLLKKPPLISLLVVTRV